MGAALSPKVERTCHNVFPILNNDDDGGAASSSSLSGAAAGPGAGSVAAAAAAASPVVRVLPSSSACLVFQVNKKKVCGVKHYYFLEWISMRD